jgi:hypothetical protein
MISMAGAAQEGIETGLGFTLKLSEIRRRPVVVRLVGDGREHGFDRVVEIAEQVVFRFAGAAEFQVAVPDVPSPANLRSYVVATFRRKNNA